MLKIYNTLTRQKETFKPLQAGKVNMYVCGMTVYDLCHVGHARVMVVFDMVTRYLRNSGYDVTYVRNITDIDDKIIKRAQENGEDMAQLTERYIQAMHEDATQLGVLPPDAEPKATEHMPQIIAMIERLMANDLAYVSDSGDVCYAVDKFVGYGKLSGKNIDDLQAGQRVEVDSGKRNPLDFVLWKPSKKGEPAWESPWGSGRPGWHIECSAMSCDCLGEQFDIHGGGMDLTFPHHENEIAQSEGANQKTFVNTWMHNGFVRINEEKMSKSLGNFFTVREVLKQFKPEVVRFFILSSHYRSPLDYSMDNLENAASALDRLYLALREVTVSAADNASTDYAIRFNEAMKDDFNTPGAMAVLFDLARELNKAKQQNETAQAAALAGELKTLGGILGLLQDDAEIYLTQAKQAEGGWSDDEIDALVQQRTQAKADKNWAEADRIRDELSEAGVVLEDKVGETLWRRG